jgi:hypothetical protein
VHPNTITCVCGIWGFSEKAHCLSHIEYEQKNGREFGFIECPKHPGSFHTFNKDKFPSSDGYAAGILDGSLLLRLNMANRGESEKVCTCGLPAVKTVPECRLFIRNKERDGQRNWTFVQCPIDDTFYHCWNKDRYRSEAEYLEEVRSGELRAKLAASNRRKEIAETEYKQLEAKASLLPLNTEVLSLTPKTQDEQNCDKKKWSLRTEKMARLSLQEEQSEKPTLGLKSYYKCKVCDWYHLSSQEPSPVYELVESFGDVSVSRATVLGEFAGIFLTGGLIVPEDSEGLAAAIAKAQNYR